MRPFVFALAAVLVLAGGVWGTVVLVQNKPQPRTVTAPALGRLVRIRELRKQAQTFWVSAYGAVRPKIEVTLVPEVSGRIISRAPGFRSGGFIKKGDLLVEIDPRNYRLTVAQRLAQIGQLEADIARILQTEKNYRANLAINERNLNLAKTEYDRNRKLRKQGVVSQRELDLSRQAVFRLESTYQNQVNAIALVPSQLAQKRAALEVTRAQYEEAKLNLQRTKIYAPFDGRVREAGVDVSDYARSGQSIGIIHDMSVVEIPVSVPVEDARWALRRAEGMKSFPRDQEEMQRFFSGAEILWTRLGQTFSWKGQVTFVGASLDEATRAITFTVEVKNPLEKFSPGVHPPLLSGMFVRVRIRGITVQNVFVIPRSALRPGNRVYIFDNGLLDVRPVEVVRKAKDEVVIGGGLQESEKLILSAIPDAVAGMMLRAREARPNAVAASESQPE